MNREEWPQLHQIIVDGESAEIQMVTVVCQQYDIVDEEKYIIGYDLIVNPDLGVFIDQAYHEDGR